MPLPAAENAIRTLRKLQLIDYDHEFQRTEQVIVVPLLREMSERELSLLRKQLGEVVIQLSDFAKVVQRPKNLAASLEGNAPEDLVENLPRSYDVIGDIAVVEVPEGVQQFAPIVGQSILKINPHVRLVLQKASRTEGKYRIRGFKVIAGMGGTETTYCEFACRYHLDVSTVYFNPRLSHERMRVARQVMPGEVIVDMFAGVGPYSILMAKQQPKSTVYSVDLNPAAITYLKENVFMNSVADRVIPICGDANLLARGELRGIANRVIMNLPSESVNYIPAAAQLLREQGGMIHFYAFANRDQSIEEIRNSFQLAVAAQDRKAVSFQFCKTIKGVSSSRVEVAIDAQVV